MDNAIQRLGKYEETELKREREDIGMYSMNKPYLINIIRKDVDGTAVMQDRENIDILSLYIKLEDLYPQMAAYDSRANMFKKQLRTDILRERLVRKQKSITVLINGMKY